MVVAHRLQIFQKLQNHGCIQIGKTKFTGRSAGPCLHESKKQSEGVTVDRHRPGTDLFVLAEMLREEGLHGRRKLS